MKEKLLLTVSSLLVASFAPIHAQELTGTPKENTTETVTLSKSQTSSSINTPDREIAIIDAKFAYFSKNQAEYDRAKADGTMDALETKRQQLVLEKNKPANPASSQQTVELHAVTTGTMSAGKTAPAETVEHLDAVIMAIDSKVAAVKTDPDENQKALDAGWFDMMAKQRTLLVDKKTALLKVQEENK